MKFLLFFVSSIFSFIFYIFYCLSIWKDIFLNTIFNSINLESFSWNLLIESVLFFIIWVIFIIIFSEKKGIVKINPIKINKNIILHTIFYYILGLYLYLNTNLINLLLIINIILLLLSDLLFNYFSNLNSLNKSKNSIRILWLILNYISSFISVYYILNNDTYLVSILILIFNIIFNINVHKKYTNYISLLFSILSIGFLFYILYFWLFELYILYI
jgi:hypothetical protein